MRAVNFKNVKFTLQSSDAAEKMAKSEFSVRNVLPKNSDSVREIQNAVSARKFFSQNDTECEIATDWNCSGIDQFQSVFVELAKILPEA